MQIKKTNMGLPKYDTKRSRIKRCPCGRGNHDGKFVPHVGFDDCGYCHSCDKFFKPEGEKALIQTRWEPLPKVDVFYLPKIFVEKSVGMPNNLLTYLSKTFNQKDVLEAALKYFVGSSNKVWKNATVFFYHDYLGNCARGKIIPFDLETGKRLKNENGKGLAHSIHALMNKKEEKPIEPLFGEHLLKGEPQKIIGLVESEKTTLAASIVFPELLWVSCGGAANLKPKKLSVLKGRKIIIYPDVDKMEAWQTKAKALKGLGFNIQVSNIIFKDREMLHPNADLFDWLLCKQSQKGCAKPETETYFEQLQGGGEIEINGFGYPQIWDEQPLPDVQNDYWIEKNKSENAISCQPVLSEINPEAPYSLSNLLLPAEGFWYTGKGIWNKESLDEVFKSRPKKSTHN